MHAGCICLDSAKHEGIKTFSPERNEGINEIYITSAGGVNFLNLRQGNSMLN